MRKKNSYELLEGGGFMSVASDLDWLAWYKLAKWPGGLIGLFGWFLIGFFGGQSKEDIPLVFKIPRPDHPFPCLSVYIVLGQQERESVCVWRKDES